MQDYQHFSLYGIHHPPYLHNNENNELTSSFGLEEESIGSSVLTETFTVLREESNNFSLESDCSIKESLFEGKVTGGQESFGLPLALKESLFSLLNLT